MTDSLIIRAIPDVLDYPSVLARDDRVDLLM